MDSRSTVEFLFLFLHLNDNVATCKKGEAKGNDVACRDQWITFLHQRLVFAAPSDRLMHRPKIQNLKATHNIV